MNSFIFARTVSTSASVGGSLVKGVSIVATALVLLLVPTMAAASWAEVAFTDGSTSQVLLLEPNHLRLGLISPSPRTTATHAEDAISLRIGIVEVPGEYAKVPGESAEVHVHLGRLRATFSIPRTRCLPVGDRRGGRVSAEHLAFFATVTGGGTTAANNKGIWRSLNGAAPTLVLRTGDSMTMTPGSAKTIESLDLPGSGYDDHIWETPVMDANGRLLVFVTFTDGTTTQVIVP